MSTIDNADGDAETADFFVDPSLIADPYPFFDRLRSESAVLLLPPHGILTVTGHAEATAAYRDKAMSSCVSVAGPFSGISFESPGDDVTARIAENRHLIPMNEHMVTMDLPEHTRARGLLQRLLSPTRLRENEDFMERLADAQIDEFVARGRCEFLDDYAKPFAMLVIADLLGVPQEDHPEFRAEMGGQGVGRLDDEMSHNPLAWHDEKFYDYITDRRARPRDDALTKLASARYPDGTLAEVDEIVRLAALLFTAGSETTVKLLSTSLRIVADNPDIQRRLRQDRGFVPAFLEEALRLESPVKSHFRMAAKSTMLGTQHVPAGSILMILPGACNRDARQFEDPERFDLDRANVTEHLAFGRGVHTCPGAPLARAEARITLNRMLDRMSEIRISDQFHGPAGDRRFTYEPTFILRGLTALHLDFTESDQTPGASRAVDER